MKVSFAFDKRSTSEKKPLIGYISNHPDKNVKFSTGIRLLAKNWDDSKKEIVGNSNEAVSSRDKLYQIKRLLEIEIPQSYEGFVTSEDYKKELQLLFNNKPKEKAQENTLLYYFEKYRELNNHFTYNTLRMYGTVAGNIKDYCQKSNRTTNVKRLADKAYSLEFFQGYLDYLASVKNYLNPTIETDFKKIDAVINYFDLEIKSHKKKLFNSFSKKINYEQTKSIVITPEEAQIMWEYDSDNQNEWEAKMCYLFSYETGLEISALPGVTLEGIETIKKIDPDTGKAINFEVMNVITKKYRKSNMRKVYLTKRAKEILEQCKSKQPFTVREYNRKLKTMHEYENCALPVNFNLINRYIKSFAHKAVLNKRKQLMKDGFKVEKLSLEKEVTYIKYRRNDKIVTKEPKYNLITMHTARHSFINNVKLNGRLNITEAGELAGHGSYKTTERYYERNNIENTLMMLHKAHSA